MARTKTQVPLEGVAVESGDLVEMSSISMALTGFVGQESTHWAQWTHRSLWMTILNFFSASLTDVISIASAGQSRSQARQTMHELGVEERRAAEALGHLELLERDSPRWPVS